MNAVRRARRALGVTLVAALVASVAACGNGDDKATNSAGDNFPSIVVGTGIDTAYAVLLAAVKQGFFDKNGVKAELKIFQSGIEAVEGVATGEADVAGGGSATVINAAAKGANVRFIGTYSKSDKQTGVVAVAAVTKPQDLAGHTVCTQKNGNSEYYYHKFTQHYGIDESTITFKDIKYQLLPAALATGECDVIFSQEPAITRTLQTAKGSHVLARGGDEGINPLLVQAMVSQKIWSNDKLAVAVVRSLAQAGDWANAHHADLAKLLSQNFKIPADDAATYVEYFDYSFRFDDQVLKDFQDTAQYSAARGDIPKDFDINTVLFPDPARVVIPDRTYAG